MVNLIRRRDPMDPGSMLPVMNRLMGQFFGDPLLGDMPMGVLEEGALPLDISETQDHILVRASLPGFGPDDIDIQVENGILTIRAERGEEFEDTGERYYRRERVFGSVSRRVALPANIRGDAVDADLESGILTLRIPKSEEAKPRRIQVRGGQGHARRQVGVGAQGGESAAAGRQGQKTQQTAGQGQPSGHTRGQGGGKDT